MHCFRYCTQRHRETILAQRACNQNRQSRCGPEAKGQLSDFMQGICGSHKTNQISSGLTTRPALHAIGMRDTSFFSPVGEGKCHLRYPGGHAVKDTI